MKTILFASLGFLAVAALGCGPATKPLAPAPPKEVHNHPEHGPHGGELIELGKEEYHAELVHDEATKKVTIYLLDHEAKKAVAIEAGEVAFNLIPSGQPPKQFKLPAVREESDPAGKSSRFELTEADLCDTWCTKGTKARLNVTIDGTPFSGEITSEDEHDHTHHKK